MEADMNMIETHRTPDQLAAFLDNCGVPRTNINFVIAATLIAILREMQAQRR